MNQPLEKHIQTQIINYLKYRGWYVQRMNSGAIRANGKNGRQYMVKMGEFGTPDILAFRSCTECKDHWPDVEHSINLIFIEVKRPGKSPTLHQKIKMKELETFGARTLVAHSVEEVEAFLNGKQS